MGFLTRRLISRVMDLLLLQGPMGITFSKEYKKHFQVLKTDHSSQEQAVMPFSQDLLLTGLCSCLISKVN